MPPEINLPTLWLALTGLGVPVLTVIVSMIWTGRRSDKKEAEYAHAALAQRVTDLQVHVAENYVSVERLNKLEESISVGLKRLEDKVDKVLLKSMGVANG
jgi:hypothetical protein